MTTTEWRDQSLGAALRTLDVPGHRPGFFEDLRGRLVQERLEVPLGREHPRPAPRPGGRPSHPVRWALAAAAVLVAIALVVVEVTLPGEQPRRVASAAEVRAFVVGAVGTTRSVAGEVVFDDEAAFGAGEVRYRFVLTERGDFRWTGITREEDLAYDAGTNLERGWSRDEDGNVFAGERTGLAPAPPDPAPVTFVLDRTVGSVVRALEASEGGRVREGSYQDRAVWVLDTDIRVNLIAQETAPDHVTTWIDRDTGFPLRTVFTRDGTLVRETRLEDLVVDGSVEPGTFALQYPEGAQVSRTDQGFTRVAVDQVESEVGYDPLVPEEVPQGYRLADVAVSEQGTPTGTEGVNPVTGGVVSMAYRRGLDRFVVTTRLVGPDPALWYDPLGSGEGFIDQPEVVRIEGGALDGVAAELLIDPLAEPHVWAIGEGLVVTVSGDLSRAELLQVASSLD